MRKLLTIAIITFLGLSSAQAHLALRSKNFSPSAAERDISSPKNDLNLLDRKFLKDNGKKYQLSTQDVALVVPTNMGATNNQKAVQERIMHNTINSILNSKYIKNSALAQTYDKVKETAKLDVSIKEGAKTVSQEEKPVEHKFKFDYRLLDTNAIVTYSGYFDTTVQYVAQSRQMVISISEKVGESSSINISHNEVPEGSTQLVQFSTNW